MRRVCRIVAIAFLAAVLLPVAGIRVAARPADGGPLAFRLASLVPYARVPAQRAILNVVLREEPAALLACPEHHWILRSADPVDRLFAGLWWARMGFPHLAMRSLTDSLQGGGPLGVIVPTLTLVNEVSAKADVPGGPWLAGAASAAGDLTGDAAAAGRYIIGREMLNTGQPDRADAILSGIPASSPLHGRASYLRGLAAVALKRWRGAVEALSTACWMAESDGDRGVANLSHLALARVAAESGLPDIAERHYAMVKGDPEPGADAAYEAAVVLILSGRTRSAIGHLSRLRPRDLSPFARPEAGLVLGTAMDYLCFHHVAQGLVKEWEGALRRALAAADGLEKALGADAATSNTAITSRPAPGDVPAAAMLGVDERFRAAHAECERIPEEIARARTLPGEPGRIAANSLGRLLDDARAARVKAAREAVQGLKHRISAALLMTEEEMIDLSAQRIALIQQAGPRPPVEAMVLAAVVDMTRAGAPTPDIWEAARRIIGSHEFVMAPEDSEWLLKMRVAPEVVKRLESASPPRSGAAGTGDWAPAGSALLEWLRGLPDFTGEIDGMCAEALRACEATKDKGG